MNTPAHLIVGAAAFGHDRKTMWAAIGGGILPDLSLYLLVFWAMFVQQIPESVIFNQFYFSDAWQGIFAVDNSFILWGAVLGLGLYLTSGALTAFAGSGLVHIGSDFLLHHDDGRAHFWPLSDWVFESPFSYWDSGHHALWIGPILALVTLVCVVVLWRRHAPLGWRLAFFALLMLEVNTLRSWVLYF